MDHRLGRVSQVEDEEEEEEHPCCNISKKAMIWGIILFVLVLSAILGVVFGVLKLHQAPQLKKWQGAGTTLHFREIVLGRCYTYTQLMKPELRVKDCQKIVGAFMGAVLSKDPCGFTEGDYQPLIKLTNQTVPCDKTLFWSKSRELAHQYTKVQQEMFTLEDTLLGYMADGLKWCGDAGSSEMNYQSCPDWRGDCANNTMSVFWDTVSKWFAENACGVVQVLLNGSFSNAFNKNSTFGRVEIYNLHPDKVSTLQAWVMHNIEDVHSDSCSASSINDLKSISSNRNITFTCQSNYRPIKFLQCVKNPEHSSCNSLI